MGYVRTGRKYRDFGSFASDVLRSNADDPSNLRQRYTRTYRTSVSCTPVFSSSEMVHAISVRVLLSYPYNTRHPPAPLVRCALSRSCRQSHTLRGSNVAYDCRWIALSISSDDCPPRVSSTATEGWLWNGTSLCVDLFRSLFAYLVADDPRHLHPSIRNIISYPRGTCPLASSHFSSGYMLSFFVATTNGD